MNVVLNYVRLVEMKPNVIQINERVVMAKGVRKLPVTLERLPTDPLVPILVGFGLLIGMCGCDISPPIASTLSEIPATSTMASGRESRTPPRVIDLGEVSPGGRIRQWIEINNPHAHDFEVSEVSVGCECVSVTLGATRIPAEQSVRALVVADLSHLPDFRGGLGVSVTIRGSDGTKCQQFRVDVRVAEDTGGEK